MNTPHTPPAKAAAIYRRVSTDKQDGSLETQEARLGQYCQLMGFDQAGREFADEDTSGAVAIWERTGGAALVEAIKRGEVRHLVVSKLDRIGRSARDFHNFLHWLGERSVVLHIMDLGGSICTTEGSGKLLLGVLALVAEFERDLIRGRIKERLNHKFQKGEVIGTIPYGWDSQDTGGTRMLIPNEAEQKWIWIMAGWRSSGMGFHKIAAELNRSGVPTKIPAGSPICVGRDKVTKERIFKPHSGQWQYVTVKTVLESKHTTKILQ